MTQAHRQSSGCTNLLVPEHAVPSILLYFLQPLSNRQRSTSHYQPISVFTLFSTHLLYQREQPLGYIPPFSSPHTKKRQEHLQLPPLQPATKQLHICNFCIMWQILSAIRPPSSSVWLPSIISILSKSPKIVSCFYPALCSFYDKSSFQIWLTAFLQQFGY